MQITLERRVAPSAYMMIASPLIAVRSDPSNWRHHLSNSWKGSFSGTLFLLL